MLYSRLTYYTIEVIEYLLITLFLYTGLSKLLDLATFQFQTHRSPYLENISTPISYIIPISELLVVLALVLSKFRYLTKPGRFYDLLRRYGAAWELWGLCGALFLMSLFTGYVWLMLTEAYYLPCSCGGILSALSWNDHLLFNAVFSGLVIVALSLYMRAQNLIKKSTGTV